MEQQSAGSRAANDVYNILLERVEVNGKTISLQSKPIRMIRRASSSAPSSPRGDFSAISAGTVLNSTVPNHKGGRPSSKLTGHSSRHGRGLYTTSPR